MLKKCTSQLLAIVHSGLYPFTTCLQNLFAHFLCFVYAFDYQFYLPSSSQPNHHIESPHIEVARPRLELSDSAEDPLLEEDTEKEETEMEEGETAPVEEENTVVTLLKKVGSITCITEYIHVHICGVVMYLMFI